MHYYFSFIFMNIFKLGIPTSEDGVETTLLLKVESFHLDGHKAYKIRSVVVKILKIRQATLTIEAIADRTAGLLSTTLRLHL